jgi:hypothetical protein
MKPISITIDDLQFRRPGITKIFYTADYGSIKRRGEITYDTRTKKFLSNTSEIQLLSDVCLMLREPSKVKFADK